MTQRVMKDLIFKLPVFQSPSTRGELLLAAFLERAALEKTGKQSLSNSRPYLELAQDLVIRHRASSPLTLLRYYCSTLTGRLFLQQLSPTDRLRVLNDLTDLLVFCHQNYGGDASVQDFQWKIVDASPVLLEVCISLGFQTFMLLTIHFSYSFRRLARRRLV